MMSKSEDLAIPVVSMIVERTVDGEKEILLQTRNKPMVSPKYTGLLEIPAGAIRAYEDIYDAIARELKEEVGLTIRKIKNHAVSKTYSYHHDSGFAFRPFCCQYMKAGAPFLGVVFTVEAEEGKLIAQADEVKDPHWIKVSELKKLFAEHPEKFFTLHAGVLELYLKEN